MTTEAQTTIADLVAQGFTHFEISGASTGRS
jgi:hypothetical protein